MAEQGDQPQIPQDVMTPQATQEKKSKYLTINPQEEPEAYIKKLTEASRNSLGQHYDGRDKNGNLGMGKYEGSYLDKTEHEWLTPDKMIVRYAERLLAQGTHPVTIVDFGAGEAGTLALAAVAMKNSVIERKVRFIATNLNGKPTLEDIAKAPLEDRHSLRDLETCLKENLIDFKIADILELRDMLAGQPAQLIMTQNVFPFTIKVNDFILKTFGEMLDKDKGTIVIGNNGLQSDLRPESEESKMEWATLNRGVQNIKDLGFEQLPYNNPLRIRTRHSGTEYTLFQAANAPRLDVMF